MKRFFLLTLLFLTLPAVANDFGSHKWQINDTGVSVIFEQTSYEKFAVVAKCNNQNMLFLYDLKNYVFNNIGKVLHLKIRVDQGKIYRTYGTLMQDGDSVALYINNTDLILSDMKLGKTMRVAFKLENVDEYGLIEQYSLSNFTNSLNKSLDLCEHNQLQEYFPDNETFL